MKISQLIACLSSFVFLLGCSSGGGAQDAGLPDAADAHDAGQDAGQDGGQDAGDAPQDGSAGTDIGPRPDYDPTESFLIVVPPDTGLCSTFAEGRDWLQEYPMLGRIDLREGHFVLPREEGTFPLDLVERVLFRPEQNELAPAGPGELLAEYYDWGAWSYVFTQAYAGEGKSFQVSVGLDFFSTDGIWPEVTVLDENNMSGLIHGGIKLGAGEDPISEVQVLGPCAFPDLPRKIITATTAGGEQVKVDLCPCSACNCAGNTTCYYLQSAEVNLGTYQELVDEHFRLVYSAGHHNDGEVFLIFLDPPAGQAAALLVVGPPLGSTEGAELLRLDADLNEIGREAITEWQTAS